ncbi:MAG: formylmethanofuran dehydrogenase subunit A [Acidobacteria bacterium]|nr:formylmethanofuran dehydrogenase subunit A [Acidobacteriota bacterium]
MASAFRIKGGRVIDPRNGIEGAVRDVLVENGRIVESCRSTPEEIDAKNLVIMAGGVDIHSHIASPAVNAARALRPEDHRSLCCPRRPGFRSGVGHTVPSTFTTGYLYSRLGYTTVMEAATPPIGTRHTHEELNDIPMIDKGCYLLMGNNQFVMRYIKDGDTDRLKRYVAWLLRSLKGFGLKLVNPGGVEQWKYGKDVEGLDEKVHHFEVTPRQIIQALAWVNEELGLPHSIHIHANRLGVPGNYRVTLETMRALEGIRVHMAHVQFHSYGGEDWRTFTSKAKEMADYINAHPNVTVDVGQIVFGDATTITADGPWQYRLHKMTKNKWYNADVEVETGSGVVPYTYKEKNYVNALQWAIGLETFLLIDDPWRVFLSTDHPNAGPFFYYPWIIRLLMDAGFREEMLRRVHHRARSQTVLSNLKREYSLYEIAVITRAGPARALGLPNKGHLGVGADADIAIYAEDSDREAMFERPTYVLKDGEIVVRDGEVVHSVPGRTIFTDVPGDDDIVADLRAPFKNYYTVEIENFPIPREDLNAWQAVPTGRPAPAGPPVKG